ncbi:ribbon-helix-helix protein, CopG family [Synechococcus sp. BDU 130192]|uniref:ribbon-helix-helix protein, CopG family n=1 Tax=Synechococcus sp. BDU 130192 TaxID=2042059 RepID=UPI0020B1767F|nr:ribbon-helix-helix protein, CopG family [Synechococcus sp. BDU 130192]
MTFDMMMFGGEKFDVSKIEDGVRRSQSFFQPPALPQFCCITICDTTMVLLMITLRLDPDLDKIVSNTAKNLGITKSELIRKSLVEYIHNLDQQSAWKTGKDLFGKYSSGRDDLSSCRKMLLKEKLKAKRA